MLDLNPQTKNAQTLDGRFISTLPPVETAVLDSYHSHSLELVHLRSSAI